MSNIVVLSGSVRDGSFNTKLAGSVATALGEMGHKVTLVSLVDYELPLYNGDLEKTHGVPENAVALGRLLQDADGIFIASPEYNGSVSPLLKNTIDWMSRIKNYPELDVSPFSAIVCCLGAASPGALGGLRGLNHLRDILVSIGATVISEQLSVPSAMDAFDDNGQLKNERTFDFMQMALKSLTQKASALK